MLAAEAGMDAIKAVTLSDEAVKGLAVQAAQFSDSQNKIATTENKYHQRLKKLTDREMEIFQFIGKGHASG